MKPNDKIKATVLVILILVGVVIITLIYANINEYNYKRCINNGGKAILQENGYFEKCIIGEKNK